MTDTPGSGGKPTPPTSLPVDRKVRLDRGWVPVAPELAAQWRAAGIAVSVEPDDRAEHGRDWWPLTIGWAIHDGVLPAVPAAVVRPRSADDVALVLRSCHDALIPVTPMAGRSGVCGASLPVHGGVALDLTGLTGIRSVDAASMIVDVGAGTFGDVLEHTLRETYGLTLGHWPQSIALSTVGGWLACRSAGQYSTRYGKIEDMVLGLTAVLADGTIIETGATAPRTSMGPDLTQLLVGSEGTLAVITSARLRAHRLPTAEGRAAWGFGSFSDGLDACRRILQRGATPAVLRLYDARESKRSFSTSSPTCVLLALDEGDALLVRATLDIVDGEARSGGAAALDPGLVEQWLGHRNDVSQLESVIRNDIVVDTIEVAGSWSSLGKIWTDATAAVLAVPGALVCTCHQSHAYSEGACLYFTVAGRPVEGSSRDALYTAMWDAATTATLDAGGALSHHHGIGLNRARYLASALGAGHAVLKTIKAALDPNSVLNPGKLGLDDRFGPVDWPS